MFVIDRNNTETKVPMTCKLLNKEAHEKLHKQANSETEQAKILSDLIELKANRTQNNHELSKLFFFVGLSISLLAVILVFEWKTYDPAELVSLGDHKMDFDEIIEIPPTEQAPPPPPQKIVPQVISEVADEVLVEEIEIDLDVEVTQEEVIEEVNYNFDTNAEAPPAEEVEEIYDIVQSKPEPEGGMKAFYEYVQKNMEYPASAKRLGISGRVFVQFVVEKDGSLTDVKVLKGIYDECDKEAVRVIQNAPKWNPGTQRGRPVRVYQRLPIMFYLKEL